MSESELEIDGLPGDEFGLSAVRELLRLISETDVTEIKIERGGSKLHIRRGSQPHPQPIVMTPSLAPAMANLAHTPLPPVAPFGYGTAAESMPPSQAAESPITSGNEQTITAPMVGTFYTAASPKDPAFVAEGDTIHAGEVVGIVEAMKIMNEIESEISGRIVRILVSNGQPVEYGQPLMVVEPS